MYFNKLPGRPLLKLHDYAQGSMTDSRRFPADVL